MEHLVDMVVGCGCEVDLFCTTNIRFINRSSIKLNLFWSLYLFVIRKCAILLPLKFSSSLNQKLLSRILFKGIVKKYDLVDFHSVPPYTDWYINQSKIKGIPYEITFWGADIIFASEDRAAQLKLLLDSCTKLKCTRNLYDIVCRKIGKQYSTKYKEAYFGNSGLDYLIHISSADRVNLAEKLLGRIDDKIVVTCGYNGIEVQNHELMINSLNKLPQSYKNRLMVVFPMTYGREEHYYSRVKQLLHESSFQSIVIESYLNNEELAALRWITNVMIMAQETDAFSGSVQEHLYCNNIVLIGNWLDYPLLDRSGAFYLTFAKEELTKKVTNIIDNYLEYKNRCSNNDAKLYSAVSWEARLSDWLPTYQPINN